MPVPRIVQFIKAYEWWPSSTATFAVYPERNPAIARHSFGVGARFDWAGLDERIKDTLNLVRVGHDADWMYYVTREEYDALTKSGGKAAGGGS